MAGGGDQKKIKKIVNNPLPEGLQVGTSQSTSFLVAVKGLKLVTNTVGTYYVHI